MVTRLSDVIVPDVWTPYMMEQTVKRSALFQSDIVAQDLDVDLSGGGKLVQMPFFQDLSGDEQVRQSNKALEPQKITSGKDIARLHGRANAWAAEDLTSELTSGDPMQAIANRVADYWSYRWQVLLISSLTGVFAAVTDLVKDYTIEGAEDLTDDNKIGGEQILDAKQLLGDAKDQLTAIVMHSKLHTRLQKLDLIEFIPDSQANVGWGTYMGNTVIVDDGVPREASTADNADYEYTSYLFGSGALGLEDGPVEVPTETDRDSLGGEEFLINRRNFILHPRGVAWQEEDLDQVEDDDGTTVDPDFPSNDDVEKAANWDLVYELKNIRMAKMVTNG